MRVLQFGEGNFLRAFSDCMIDIANEKGIFDGSIAVVKPKPTGSLERFRRQDCMYTVVFHGRRNGETVDSARIVTSIDAVYHPLEDYDAWMALAALDTLQFIFSNTTEAGIQYVKGVDTFPAKIARLVAARCRANLPGLVFLPCELIEHNGDKLKECTKKYIDDPAVLAWLEKECVFCSTLVDRIVAGRPDPASAERYAQQLGDTIVARILRALRNT